MGQERITIIAIADGWSEERNPATEEEALMMASCMADSGKYESVAVWIRGILKFFRKYYTSVKYSRHKS